MADNIVSILDHGKPHNLQCRCGGQWFRVEAVTLSADDGHVNGYSPYPPTCLDCGRNAPLET